MRLPNPIIDRLHNINNGSSFNLRIINLFHLIGKHIIDIAPSFIGSLAVLLPHSPLNTNYIDTDPGVFLYVGWRILNGEIPYRDIWDHKPPFIYYINALGEFLTPDSLWGIWVLELLTLFIAPYIGYQVIKSYFGKKEAWFSTFYWLITLFYVMRLGNLTEEFALPLQFALFCIFSQKTNNKQIKGYWFIIGVFFALLFLLKQTNIGLCISIFLVQVLVQFRNQNFKQFINEILRSFLGASSVLVIISTYFWSNGALDDFIENAFNYNGSYLANNPLVALKSSILGLENLLFTGFLLAGCIGYFLFFRNHESIRKSSKNIYLILLLATIDVPVEFLLISLSGRAYEHYYITLLPPLTFLVGFAFHELTGMISKLTNGKISQRFFFTYSMILLILGSILPFYNLTRSFNHLSTNEIIEAISTLSSKNDKLLVYGADVGINFQSQHTSPTKYVYQFPLYTEGYTTEKMIVGFLDDILDKKPSLILDTHNPTTPFLMFPINSSEIDQRVKIFQSRYKPIDEIMGITFYKYMDRSY